LTALPAPGSSGFAGASVAALTTLLPCYLFTIVLAPYFHEIAANTAVKSFVEGITAAVTGALAGSVIVIAMRSLTDGPTVIIAIVSLLLLNGAKKNSEPYIIIARHWPVYSSEI
jgi:chromate transporter